MCIIINQRIFKVVIELNTFCSRVYIILMKSKICKHVAINKKNIKDKNF